MSKECGCDWCSKWSPFWKRVEGVLSEEDRSLLNEHLMIHACMSDDLCAAKAKLAGDWPGWGWMKEIDKEGLVTLYRDSGCGSPTEAELKGAVEFLSSLPEPKEKGD